MNTKIASVLALPWVLFALAGAADGEAKRNDRFAAKLKPTEEVPALSSAARGWFRAWIDESNQTISYELSYRELEGEPLQAHIHIGQRGANGGVSVFLCGNAPAVPPANVPQPPACPPAPATIRGELMASHIVGPAAQGIEAASTENEFDELARMLRLGFAYANVHSSRFPPGEIRGQIRSTRKRK